MAAAVAPRLTDYAAAVELLLSSLPGPVDPVRDAAPRAVGAVVAEAVVCCAPVPAVAAAAWDGWAVAAADTQDAGPFTPVPLGAGSRWVCSGEALPDGTDSVVPPWGADDRGGVVHVTEAVTPGDGVRPVGEDVAAGTVLCAAGERLRPGCLPALRAGGIAEVSVRRPRVALLGCSHSAGGFAPEGLGSFLSALIAAEGAEAVVCAPVAADAAVIAGALGRMRGDLVLLLGGTGHGTHDRAAAGLALAGRVSVHGLGVRPGGTAGFGRCGDTAVILVPGRWEDAFAAWLLLVRPAVRHLAGTVAGRPELARLTRKVTSAVGLLDLVLVRRVGPGLVEPLATGGMPPGLLAQADGVLVVPPGSEGYDAGSEVAVETL